MPVDLTQYLTIAISSRALFKLDDEHQIFDQKGPEEYERYQIAHENKILDPGPGFPLVRAILSLNSTKRKRAEVVIISRNNPSVALRIMNSIKEHKLDITRAAFTTGTPVSKYLDSFAVTLFLSRNEDDVREALNNKIAAGLLYASPVNFEESLDEIRVAFDGDAVIFSDEAERVYKKDGLDAFLKHEQVNANKPLPEGPFAKLLKALSFLQKGSVKKDIKIRLGLFTARNSPAHERVIKTLRLWNVRIDEMFFLGGVSKHEVLKAFRPHIFFDDQQIHCMPASRVVPTAIVPTDYDVMDLKELGDKSKKNRDISE
ncbi:MAG TPA: 5'-nucleotidase [Candidatus Omnitrophota bacterium]|nr:5'-nucleotidase [Candidatus Omnitrophota bacterium]